MRIVYIYMKDVRRRAEVSPEAQYAQTLEIVYYSGMSGWGAYPSNYRADEVRAVIAATKAGECVSVVGLSGAGKSNLLGFIADRQSTAARRFVLIDSNRLPEFTRPAFLRLIRRTLGDTRTVEPDDELETLDAVIKGQLSSGTLSLLLDLSLLDRDGVMAGESCHALFSNLRALRDAHKFLLTFVTASRHALPHDTEFTELIHAHTIWLGCLGESDARWNVARHGERKELTWSDAEAETLIRLSRGYPSLLRAACEAYADGATPDSIAAHPAVQARVAEFWNDKPTDDELRLSGLAAHPLLTAGRAPSFDTSQLTAKENLLLNYFVAHPDAVCEKDDLIRAVWPEDKVFERGVRDDSLAQLIRRLREKIEPDPANPKFIHTAPGRGYRFRR
ncbi:MAG TPA: winged helix-turn-helix domain-containing protein [Anaerolineales bacterium]|nr:winged helix-turn-helix domain-containing protein [Anaerolineales bacterium]